MGMEVSSFPDSLVVGVELEIQFCPTSLSESDLRKKLTSPLDSFSEIRHKTRGLVELPEFISSFEKDLENDELIFKPLTMRQHKNNLPQYKEFFTQIKLLNCYNPISRGLDMISIQFNYDRLTITQLEKLCDLIYKNRRFIYNNSGREDQSTRLADINYLLGDKVRMLSLSELDGRFKRTKKRITQCYIEARECVALGIKVKKNKLVEIRWFGSTLDVDNFIFRMEFATSLIHCAKSPEFSDYIDFITENIELYPHLNKGNQYQTIQLTRVG